MNAGIYGLEPTAPTRMPYSLTAGGASPVAMPLSNDGRLDWRQRGPAGRVRLQAALRERQRAYRSPGDTVYTHSQTFAAGTRYYVLCNLADGRVIIFSAGGVNPAWIYDPFTDRFTQAAAPPGSFMIAATLLNDGRVFCMHNNNIATCIYNPATNTYVSTPAIASNSARLAAIVLQDGRVYCVSCNSTTSVIYDPVTNTVATPTGTFPGSSNFSCGVLLLDGRVYMPPRASGTARIYDPFTDTLTTPTGTFTGASDSWGAILLQDGRVFVPPTFATTGYLYDPVRDSLTAVPGFTNGGQCGGCLMPNGDVFIPATSGTSQIYSPSTNTVRSVPGFGTGFSWNGSSFPVAITMADGRVFAMTGNATTVCIYGDRNPTDRNLVLSSHYNKTP